MENTISDALKEMQNDFAGLSYEGRQTVFEEDKYHKLANELSDREKEGVGVIELVVHEYGERQSYIVAFCIMFPNFYEENKGYYDELIEYWREN